MKKTCCLLLVIVCFIIIYFVSSRSRPKLIKNKYKTDEITNKYNSSYYYGDLNDLSKTEIDYILNECPRSNPSDNLAVCIYRKATIRKEKYHDLLYFNICHGFTLNVSDVKKKNDGIHIYIKSNPLITDGHMDDFEKLIEFFSTNKPNKYKIYFNNKEITSGIKTINPD